jgi:hypothetical protein
MSKLGNTSYSVYKTSADLQPTFKISPDWKIFSPSGFLFYEVLWHSGVMQTSDFELELSGNCGFRSCPVEGNWALTSNVYGQSPYSGSSEARLDAFGLTLTAGVASSTAYEKKDPGSLEKFRRNFWAY